MDTHTLTHTHKHTLTHRTRPGIYVHYLVPGSKAETCGNIKPGDRILEANGVDLRDATVDEAAAFMMVSREIYTIYQIILQYFFFSLETLKAFSHLNRFQTGCKPH